MDRDSYLKLIGANIKKIRIEKGLTQLDVASECGFDKQNISRLENGRTNPSLMILKNVADVLGVTVVDLINIKSKK